ncbi:LOW QUALITY PROTEIN: hypothetical protein PHMEG_00014405 [Phytophthora megakarya]|uniref:Uncharacterized protein n=1 Tax=Phytophthora megakarya TaxID=4795 RepID=A0A225W417_9STRA|nr:LOW QUALITY PROTEIN: hypothetical protein PHMEG_00014405 [Phytophthora megakarya]
MSLRFFLTISRRISIMVANTAQSGWIYAELLCFAVQDMTMLTIEKLDDVRRGIVKDIVRELEERAIGAKTVTFEGLHDALQSCLREAGIQNINLITESKLTQPEKQQHYPPPSGPDAFVGFHLILLFRSDLLLIYGSCAPPSCGRGCGARSDFYSKLKEQRSAKAYRKTLRCTPDLFDALCLFLEPLYYRKYGLPEKIWQYSFDMDLRRCITAWDISTCDKQLHKATKNTNIRNDGRAPPSERITVRSDFYSKLKEQRSAKAYRKTLRCTPDLFDALCLFLEPLYYRKYGLPEKIWQYSFDMDLRRCITAWDISTCDKQPHKATKKLIYGMMDDVIYFPSQEALHHSLGYLDL